MCRIAGIIQNGNSKIKPEELRAFLLNMEYAGKDATGMAFIMDDSVVYNKAKGKASKVIREDFIDKVSPLVSKAKAIILHTRHATHGSPNNNNNNHPIIGDKYLLVHNGVVDSTESFEAVGETDTEQMLRSIEKYGFEKGFNKITGWVATIFANFTNLNEYYWYCNPAGSLVSAMDRRNIFFLASTMNIIKSSLINTKDLKELKIVDNTLYKYSFDADKVEIVSKPIVKAYNSTYWDNWKNYYKNYLDLNNKKDINSLKRELTYPNMYNDYNDMYSEDIAYSGYI